MKHKPQGDHRETYRRLAIHNDPWFTYAAFTPDSGVRVAVGATLKECREAVDSYIDMLHPQHPLRREQP